MFQRGGRDARAPKETLYPERGRPARRFRSRSPGSGRARLRVELLFELARPVLPVVVVGRRLALSGSVGPTLRLLSVLPHPPVGFGPRLPLCCLLLAHWF